MLYYYSLQNNVNAKSTDFSQISLSQKLYY